MSSQHKHFADSATPENIASGMLAAWYVNGFVWSMAERLRMSRGFGVSVLPDASWARQARCIDIERGAANIDNAVPFVKQRRLWLGHLYGRHFEDDSTCYVNRSNWGAVMIAFQTALVPYPRFWVATLDGTIDVSEGDIKPWAVQSQGGPTAPFDLSVLLGKDDLHRP